MGEEDDSVQENEGTVHEIEDEDGTGEEDNKSVHSDSPSIQTVDDGDDKEPRVSDEQPIEP